MEAKFSGDFNFGLWMVVSLEVGRETCFSYLPGLGGLVGGWRHPVGWRRSPK